MILSLVSVLVPVLPRIFFFFLGGSFSFESVAAVNELIMSSHQPRQHDCSNGRVN